MEKQTDDQIVEFMIIKAIKTLSHPQRLQFFDMGLSFTMNQLLSHHPEHYFLILRNKYDRIL
ncbi:hypothetical protein AAW31_13385 [Nitrosomonas communis]|uniref:Uncharacterized protein n=1 Tax=Nitrosomonas communis TaxID=44574 RepID=A0A0F7KGF4_9PROT|nr:hypothetical protein AAW31_13385 [Nitrosomonas communis]